MKLKKTLGEFIIKDQYQSTNQKVNHLAYSKE
jgi:hypothetical protein